MLAVPTQLVKTASLSLQVADATAASQRAITWVRQAGGELLNLEDSGMVGDVRRLSLELQVPAPQLETMLERLTTLGTLESRQVTAEDVSDQLVDLNARLRNLRRTEAMLLKIMERSGSVGDVLKVAQEVARVREQIEQLDAQRVNLQNRVRYARIQVQLAATQVKAPSLGDRLGETWGQATSALSQFTTGVLQIALWTVVFSPYWLPTGLGLRWFYRVLRQRRPSPGP
ncbi:MAG: DUF4349 domain-containing protein [Gloeomargarita sp. SKYBB_i_bin120]|nr:DUF4349 domain-containing protein [Gloeomargarita sp. SKYG98]MCS7291929.1 DUF4349 domain-containing protein [Gloeomargarita sp. SKYB120]MDW8177489.1 DUF4349 domain-containing protein [Gloeomargarita sp. SKYBB_i_bin120]